MAELSKLGRYQLKRVLGRGAMGVVYEGFDPTLGRRVAVKTILRNAAIDADTERAYSERFVREAKAVARLNHPHIVQVHDFGEENEVAFLVMEFIQGRELRSFFDEKQAFDIGEAVRIMGELLDALEFAHEAGVIHRDVKPANVMLDAQRRAKLTDFGVARVQDSERSAAGTMVGTPAFMSPEQISGGKIDRRSDIFSAGVILYQLLTGEQPFKGEGAWTVARKIMQEDPPQPSSLVTNISPAFDAIVERSLAKNPAQRFASAKEFAGALRAAASGGAAAPGPALAMPKPKPKAKPAGGTSEAEVEFWKAIQNSTDAAEFEFYLEQFPEGMYAPLARHKIAKLRQTPAADADATVRLEAEAAEKQRKEADERVRREAAEKARQEAEDKAKRAAQAQAETEARAKKVAEELAKRQAAEKAKRDAEVRARKAAVADPEATVAMPRPAPTAPVEEKKKSFAVPAMIGVAVLIAGAVAFVALNRKPAPAPVAETPAPTPVPAPKAEVSVADIEKIRKETEERIRREYADKSAAEQAAAAKAATEKAIQEKQLAAKVAAEKLAADKAAAGKAAEKALAEKLAAARASGEKAAQERAAAEQLAAARAAAERAAAEKAAAEKAAAERAAADAAAAKAAAEKLAAAKSAAAAGSGHEELLEKFIQRQGKDKILPKEPPQVRGAMRGGETIYVNDGSCGPGRIREVIQRAGGGFDNNTAARDSRCISLRTGAESPVSERAATEQAAAAKLAAAKAAPAGPSHEDLLEKFIQRYGRDKVVAKEPAQVAGGMRPGEFVFVNDGSCPRGQIKEVREPPGHTRLGYPRSYRCVPLSE